MIVVDWLAKCNAQINSRFWKELERDSVVGAGISAHGPSMTQVGLATETERIRSTVTAILQRDVEALGRKVLESNPGLCPESQSGRVNV